MRVNAVRLQLRTTPLAHQPQRYQTTTTTTTRSSGAEPFRRPPLRLLSAYGTALHGYTRGPRATFAEPLSSWLALLGDAVPFYKDCLIVCPSSMTEEQIRAVWRRAKAHLPTAHVAVMQENNRRDAKAGAPPLPLHDQKQQPQQQLPLLSEETTSASCPLDTRLKDTSSSKEARQDWEDHPAGPPLAASSVTAPSEPAVAANCSLAAAVTTTTTTITTTTTSTSIAAAPLSPLDNFPAASLDVVVFVGNVFADELLFDAPWHISLAHRALRPHGVLGIFGYDREVVVADPAWAAEDCRDYYAALQDEVEYTRKRLLDRSAAKSDHAPSRSHAQSQNEKRAWELSQQLEKAREVSLSERIAHVDTFFPFSAVQRRWFVSEYAMQPAGFAACVRALKSYQILHTIEQERERIGLYSPSIAPTPSPPASVLRDTKDDVPSPEETAALIPPSLAISLETSQPSAATDEESASRAAALDFVDTTASASPPQHFLTHETAAAFGPDDDNAAQTMENAAAGSLNVRRRVHAVDPLEALETCWSARAALEGQPERSRGHQPTRGGFSEQGLSTSPLRVQVNHFVITCSNRSMNVVSLPNANTGGGGHLQRRLDGPYSKPRLEEKRKGKAKK